MMIKGAADANRRVPASICFYSSTYFVALLEAFSLDAGLRVWVDSDAWGVLGSKDVVDLANQLLVLCPDHPGEQGNAVALDHANDLTFADVRHFCDDVQSLWGSAVVATAAEAATSSTTAATAASSATTVATSATARATSRSASLKSHLVALFALVEFIRFNFIYAN